MPCNFNISRFITPKTLISTKTFFVLIPNLLIYVWLILDLLLLSLMQFIKNERRCFLQTKKRVENTMLSKCGVFLRSIDWKCLEIKIFSILTKTKEKRRIKIIKKSMLIEIWYSANITTVMSVCSGLLNY